MSTQGASGQARRADAGSDFRPQRLDVAAFVRAAGQLSGRLPLGELARLAEEAQGEVSELAVSWQVRGGQRQAGDGGLRPSLHLQAELSLPLRCQRCLEPVQVALEVDRHLLFARDEASAEALDEVSEDDVLALSPELDLLALIEDELLMALPLVPRHDSCPQPVQLSAQDADFEAAEADKPKPFAALAELKRRKH